MDFTYSRQEIVEKNVYGLQWQRFEAFKSQDAEKGHFDVAFQIDGKILHANKFILTTVSETMAAMVSDRWSTKDEHVKIESYTYDNFYEFLCFLYSGDCEITQENVFQLTDMAEFYGVQLLKEFCEKFLLSIDFNYENIEEMVEVAQKYSLDDLLSAIKDFVKIGLFFDKDKLKMFKQSFIEFFISVNYGHRKEIVFERVYEWAAHQVCKQKTVENKPLKRLHEIENRFNKAVKTHLNAVLPDPKFTQMPPYFLANFIVGKGFVFSSKELRQCFMYHQPEGIEYTFEAIYRVAKKQAFQKHKMSSGFDGFFNIDESIKADLAEVIRHVEFYKMDKEFLINFVFERGFFLSPDDFSKYLIHERRNFFSPEYDETWVLIDMYELAEKQALQKQKMASDPDNFDLVGTIKSDLSKVLPNIEFFKMDETFLNDFVVANGIIAEEQASHVRDTRVQIENDGKIICAVFQDDLKVLDTLKTIQKYYFERRGGFKVQILNCRFPVPTTQSTIIINEKIQWYLCLEEQTNNLDGILTFKHHSIVAESDYLIAEMNGDHNFELISSKPIRLVACFNNI